MTEQLDTTGRTDAMVTTGFHFDHDANNFKINNTSIKIDGGRRRDLIHVTNYPLKNIDRSILRYCWTLRHFHNPPQTVALHVTTIVIHSYVRLGMLVLILVCTEKERPLAILWYQLHGDGNHPPLLRPW